MQYWLRPLFLLALLAPAQQPEAIQSPTPGSIHPPGPVRIIAKTDNTQKVLLDGVPLSGERPAEGVFFASPTLAAGPHEIAVGAEKVKIQVAGGANFRVHPPGGPGCDTCHAVRNGVWGWKRASLVGVCFQCHDKEAFPKVHTHEAGVLPDCQMCHSPHGSAAKSHLKLEKPKACVLCHAAQH